MLFQERSTRTFIAVFTLVAAIFLAVNHVIDSAPLREWWLAGLLLFISVAFWVWLWQERVTESHALAVRDDVDTLPQAKEWEMPVPDPRTFTTEIEEVEEAAELTEEPEAAPVAEETLEHAEPETEPVVQAEESPEPEEAAVPDDAHVPEDAPIPPEASTPHTASVPHEVSAMDASPAVAEGEEVELPETSPEDAEAEVTEEVIERAKEEGEIAEDVVADAMAAPPAEVEPPDAEQIEEAGGTLAEPDDLRRIEGIGPKYSKTLIAAGIGTFAALAEADQETLEKIITDAGMTRPPSLDTWKEQAAYAARGDWDGLTALQNTLIAGRRPD